MNITKETVTHCFFNHPPTPQQSAKYPQIVSKCVELAELILDLCPASRETSLALTHLQEVKMWANTSIAVNETLMP